MGKVILTVSRPSVASLVGGGVTAIRTVSFLGSLGSAMVQSRFNQRLPETDSFVTA